MKKISALAIIFTLVIMLFQVTLQVVIVNAQTPNASLTVTKTGTPLTQPAPGTITWNVTVENTGDVLLTGINVTDSRHGALGAFGSLAPGASGFFTIVESSLPSGTYTDQAFAAGYYAPENLTVIAFSDTVSCVVTVPTAGISFTKTPSATKVLNGTSVSFLYNATNTGDTALTGAIYDDVFGPVGYFVDLQPGGWVGFNVTHVLTQNTTNTATAYGVDSFGSNVTASATVFVQVYNPTIESCDSTGTTKDIFNVGDDVYVKGTGYLPSTTYDLYVVKDEAVWGDGMIIPSRISGTATTVSSDAWGDVPATNAWTGPLVPGKYDVVVDVNGNGMYDASIDALDDSDIEVTGGFLVIPEVPLGTLFTTLGMLVAFTGYVRFKRYRKK